MPCRCRRGAFRWLALGAAVTGLGLGGVAAEDPPAARAYTLPECLAIGLERAASLANARRDEVIAGSRIRQTRAQVLPQLSGSASYTRLDEVPTFTYDDESAPMGRHDNYAASAGLSQLLFSGGSVRAALDAAQFYRDRSRLQTLHTERALSRDIKQGFYGILLARARVKVQEESVAQLRELVRQAEEKYQAETISEFELLSARVKLANEVPVLIAARKELDLARAQFRDLLHLDEDRFELAGELTYTPFDLPLDALQIAARAHRPEIGAQRQMIGLRQSDIRAERGGYYPQIRARAAYEGSNPESGSAEDAWKWGWNAGLALQWDLADGGLRSGRLLEKSMELAKAEQDLDELLRAIGLEVQQAYLVLRQAAETVAASRENVALAERSLAIAKTRYQAGLATYLEYTDANLALSTARLTWLSALCGHLAALADLRYACGEPDEPAKETQQHE